MPLMKNPHLRRRQIAALVAGGALVAAGATPVLAHFGRPAELVATTTVNVSEDADEGLWQQADDPEPAETEPGDQAETPEPTETPEPKHTEKPESHHVSHFVSANGNDQADENDQGENEQADDDDQGENDQADESDSGSGDHENGGDSGDSGGD